MRLDGRKHALACAWLCVLSASCKAPKERDESLASAAVVKPTPSGLSINGEAWPVERALTIGTEGETAVRWVLSPSQLDCDTLRQHYPERPPATLAAVDFVLMQPLDVHGELGRWSFLSAHMTDGLGSRGLVALGGLVEEVRASAGKMTASGLELALQDPRGSREVLYSGDVEAVDCGRVKRPEPARPQRELSLLIGSKKQLINGASLRHEAGKYHLRLTRAPHGCNSIFTNGYDTVVDLTIEGEPAALTLASISGECLPDSPSASLASVKTSLRFVGQGLEGKGPVKLEIDARLSLHGYPLEVVGTIDALRCIRTPAAAGSAAAAAP